jgi:hypothetical protein
MPRLIDRVTNWIQRLRPPAETTQTTSYERAGRNVPWKYRRLKTV